RLEPVATALTAENGFLLAAERRGRVEAGVRVGPNDARAGPLPHPGDERTPFRPDPPTEGQRRGVCLLDRLLPAAGPQEREDGTEDLLLGDAVALSDVGEDRRREPVSLLRKPAGRLVDLGALLGAGGHELLDLLELLLRVDRADVGVLVERIADAERREPALELLDDRLGDRFLYEQPR